MNAAGTCKTVDDVEILVTRSPVGAIVVGSITALQRQPNPEPRYWFSTQHDYALNSMGLPNLGMDYYETALPHMATLCSRYNQPLIVSVAGFSPEEYARLALFAYDHGANLVELNFGCPNIWGDAGQKPIVSFALDLMQEILRLVSHTLGARKVSVKLSPYSDPSMIRAVAELLSQYPVVAAVVTSNTFPNATVFDKEGTPYISGTGLAGLSGSVMKPIGLGQVVQFHQYLPEHIQIAGVGGISTQKDVRDYLRAGATVVQIGTSYIQIGVSVFEQIMGGSSL